MTQERAAIPTREGYLTTQDGLRLWFQVLGDGAQAVVVPNGIYLLDDFRPLAEGRTLIFYDLRNRGRSDQVSDAAKLRRGIHNDVDDLEAVRRHFGIDKVSVIGHSYVGLMAVLYAMRYLLHVDRVVQVGPTEPRPGKQYPAHLTGVDATLRDVLGRLAQLQKERQTGDPEEFCRRFWSILRVIYVANPADADKIDWGRCDLPNELNFMRYWNEHVFPSLRSLALPAEELAKVTAPVLTIHGTRDRSAPYGGGREWALLLPNARLVTVEVAAHAPWIEAPERVFGSIRTFLDGAWPEAAEQVASLDPRGEPAPQQ
jgi:pimeloyl-ACP methyl ester carboxylesterase